MPGNAEYGYFDMHTSGPMASVLDYGLMEVQVWKVPGDAAAVELGSSARYVTLTPEMAGMIAAVLDRLKSRDNVIQLAGELRTAAQVARDTE